MKPLSAGPEDDRIRTLVAQAEASFASGDPGEAALVFGRVLAHDPAHAVAREGVERAKNAVSEAERRAEAQVAEARTALARGDAARARELLEAAIDAVGHNDAAAALLDRLDERRGLLLTSSAPPANGRPSAGVHAEAGSSGMRRAFVGVWTVAIVLFAGSLAFSWERLLGRLVQPPLPSAEGIAPAARLPQPTLADASLSEAKQRLEAGDPATALLALRRIEPGDAAWPFAQQLRAQALSRLTTSTKEDRR